MTTNQPRVWLITGASSGFGRAIAECALAAGDIVVAAARRTDALADLVASAPERVTALALDVTDADRIRAAVAEVLDQHGRIDDPAKAAAAILLALDSEDPPLRLALGNDAVDAIAECSTVPRPNSPRGSGSVGPRCSTSARPATAAPTPRWTGRR